MGSAELFNEPSNFTATGRSLLFFYLVYNTAVAARSGTPATTPTAHAYLGGEILGHFLVAAVSKQHQRTTVVKSVFVVGAKRRPQVWSLPGICRHFG